MIDIQLTKDDFLINSNNKLSFREDSDCIAQKIYIYLKTQIGSYFYDDSAGIPWKEIISDSSYSEEIEAILIHKIAEINGVKNVINVKVLIDTNRNLIVELLVEDVFGKFIKISDNF